MAKDCWSPFQEGYLKLNVDGAIFFDLQQIGVEAILPDEKGNCVVAAIWEVDAYNLEIVEAVAILRSLTMYASRHLSSYY